MTSKSRLLTQARKEVLTWISLAVVISETMFNNTLFQTPRHMACSSSWATLSVIITCSLNKKIWSASTLTITKFNHRLSNKTKSSTTFVTLQTRSKDMNQIIHNLSHTALPCKCHQLMRLLANSHRLLRATLETAALQVLSRKTAHKSLVIRSITIPTCTLRLRNSRMGFVMSEN